VLRLGGRIRGRSVHTPIADRPPDSLTFSRPPSDGFTLSDEEFITGADGSTLFNDVLRAGHFLTVLNWSAPIDEVAQAHALFGFETIPLLRAAL